MYLILEDHHQEEAYQKGKKGVADLYKIVAVAPEKARKAKKAKEASACATIKKSLINIFNPIWMISRKHHVI